MPNGYLECSISSANTFLNNHGLLSDEDRVIQVSKAGPGNMNLVLRVETELNSIILKQARPWVEKFPQIPAPQDRAYVEATVYALTEGIKGLGNRIPQLLYWDGASNTLVLKDESPCSDSTELYAGSQLGEPDLVSLLDFLNRLHSIERETLEPDILDNFEMRLLNHEHCFIFPFNPPPDFSLKSFGKGLDSIAQGFRQNTRLARAVHELGALYLLKGNYLVHGDFYPGSWLRTKHSLKVIDLEFAHWGQPEWDLGVLYAHLLMANQKIDFRLVIETHYHARPDFNWARVAQFAGAEIFRRILGLAQLPLTASVEQKEAWLKFASGLVLNPLSTWKEIP